MGARWTSEVAGASRHDAGKATVEKVHVITIARGDDFTESVFVMRFEEKLS